MMRRLLALAGAAILILGAVGPAGAESRGELQTLVDLGLGLRFGREGFTVDGRVNGPGGPWGLRLDGRLRPEGFTLDGRVDDPQRNYDFRLDGSFTATPKL
jgi:hypothetical protein